MLILCDMYTNSPKNIPKPTNGKEEKSNFVISNKGKIIGLMITITK